MATRPGTGCPDSASVARHVIPVVMQDLIEQPPSRKRLKEESSTGNVGARGRRSRLRRPHDFRHRRAGRSGNGGADFLVDRLSVCRADFGFTAPEDAVYAPVAVQYNPRTDPPALRCGHLPIRPRPAAEDGGRRRRSRSTTSPRILCSWTAAGLRGRSRAGHHVQRLAFARRRWDDVPQRHAAAHAWTEAETAFVGGFSETFLGPIAGVSPSDRSANRRASAAASRPARPRQARRATRGERGCAARRSPRVLGKSARTIESQLAMRASRSGTANHAS